MHSPASNNDNPKSNSKVLGDEDKDGHQPVIVNEDEGDQSQEEKSVKVWEKGRTEMRRAQEV